MKKDIVLCGVGGDGIVSVAKIISDAALNMGRNLKQSEIHGMSQRGGSVFSHLRISDNEIFADVIPEGQADIILSSEPMEALRYLPWLSKEGWVITNNDPFINIGNYPDMALINAELGKLEHVVSFNANEIAKQLKARSNMVLLGATVPYLCCWVPRCLISASPWRRSRRPSPTSLARKARRSSTLTFRPCVPVMNKPRNET